VKLRGERVGFVNDIGFKPKVKERGSYRCTEWWIRRGRSDRWRNMWVWNRETGIRMWLTKRWIPEIRINRMHPLQWPRTLNFTFDQGIVSLWTKYISVENYLVQKLLFRHRNTHIHTHTGPSYLPEPLNSMVYQYVNIKCPNFTGNLINLHAEESFSLIVSPSAVTIYFLFKIFNLSVQHNSTKKVSESLVWLLLVLGI